MGSFFGCLNRYTTTIQNPLATVMIVKVVWGFEGCKNSKLLRQRKLFGTYFRSISWHKTDQYRLIFGRNANTEKEEDADTKTDTKLTSNYQPENLKKSRSVKIIFMKPLRFVKSPENVSKDRRKGEPMATPSIWL